MKITIDLDSETARKLIKMALETKTPIAVVATKILVEHIYKPKKQHRNKYKP